MAKETASDECLSTGLASLDGHIEGNGFSPETLLALRAPARSVGRRVLFNLCGDRPIHYVAVGHDATRYVEHIGVVSGTTQRTTTASIPIDEPSETLCDRLESERDGLETGTTLLIDPMTPIEAEGHSETAATMAAIRQTLTATQGLGVVLGIDTKTGNPPEGRWVTLSQADGVLSVVHETAVDDVSHALAVDRLPMNQRFRDDDSSRCFELPPTLDLALDTSKTLSP